LKGSFIFLSDLVRRINRPLQVDFLVAASYGAGTVSSGDVRLLYDPETVLTDRHILLTEDIVDTGRTLNRLVELLREARAAWKYARCCTSTWRTIWCWMPNSWVSTPEGLLVGYGLDHAENFRHLPYIASLTDMANRTPAPAGIPWAACSGRSPFGRS
jgi:hypoxanthine phosphoribosyltransferase